MRYYAISYDAVTTTSVQKQLLAFLAESRSIMSWSKPFDGLILVKSTLSKEQLAEVFRSFFSENVQFLVSQAERDYSFGYFSKTVWDWFNQQPLLQLAVPQSE
jgi:hypothetical protein